MFPHVFEVLITAAYCLYDKVCADSMNRNFVTLQKVMESIPNSDGGNNFKLPHMNKIAKIRAGGTLEDVRLPPFTFKKATTYLENCAQQEK